MKFRLLIDYEVIEFLETLPRADRLMLRNQLVAIQNFPSRHSDYHEYDSEGRRIEIHVCGKFAIKFWADHADKHLKILDVHLADRPR
jgi:hypothetical protein